MNFNKIIGSRLSQYVMVINGSRKPMVRSEKTAFSGMDAYSGKVRAGTGGESHR